MNTIGIEKIEGYKQYLAEEEKAKATIEKYLRDVMAFCRWTDGREVCKKLVLEYKAKLMEKYKDRSVNSILSSLNSLFEYLGLTDCKVKTLKIQRQIFADNETVLSEEEYERLLKAAKNENNERLYLLMQTICATGIRVSELKYITVEAVSYRQAHIRKKGKSRDVLLPKGLCRMLRRYAKKMKITSGSIFITKSGKPLNRSNIWADMKRLCKAAGVSKRKVFPHNLRHLFARKFYSIEKDIVRLADILGHGSINTTRIYTMESGDVHRKQIEKMGLLRC